MTRTPNDADESEQDHSLVKSTRNANDTPRDARTDEVRCPDCQTPVPAMLLVAGEIRVCPECGPRTQYDQPDETETDADALDADHRRDELAERASDETTATGGTDR